MLAHAAQFCGPWLRAFASMTDSIQWYYYADAAPPAPPRAPCNDRTHAGAVFEGTPFSYHLKGDFSYQYTWTHCRRTTSADATR